MNLTSEETKSSQASKCNKQKDDKETDNLNNLRPKTDCQLRIGNNIVQIITLPGTNPILNTHTNVDEIFGLDLSHKLF